MVSRTSTKVSVPSSSVKVSIPSFRKASISGWLASPAHRETLLSTKFQEFGLAVATVPANRKSKYRVYWAFIAGGPFEAWYE